jgi:hypothetical protein
MSLDRRADVAKGGDVTATMQGLQAIAETVEREEDKHGNGRNRLDLTIFLHDDGSVHIYTSMVGISGEAVRAVEPVVRRSNRLEASGALAEIVRMSKPD